MAKSKQENRAARGKVGLTMRLALLAEIDQLAAADLRNRSSMVEVLVTEAIDSRRARGLVGPDPEDIA
jgi:metal-responsive CopG/Arc/MetJ family transcriptional regulator